MVDFTADFTLEPQPEMTADFNIEVTNLDHNALINRDLANQHPMSAITGLEIALDGKQNTLTSDNAGEGISIDVVDGVVKISSTLSAPVWGSIQGTLSDQTDLQYALDQLSSSIDSNHREISNIGQTIGTYGNIVTHDVSEFATAAQGSLADSALQAGDNISLLNNNAGFITSSDIPVTDVTVGGISVVSNKVAVIPAIPTVNNASLSIEVNGTQVASFTANSSTNTVASITVPTDTSDLTNGAGYITGITSTDVTTALGYTPYSDANPDGYQTSSDVANAVSGEATLRQNADTNLQNQIDAITAASDVTDIVGTYAQLQAYDTTTLPNNSIIKVLQDESRDDETTYYRWVITNNVGAWVLIGEEGPYYTKSQADSAFVPQTRTVNNKALSADITLTASDVGALPSSTTIGNGTLTIQKNGTTVQTFTANQTGNVTANISVPTDTGDLTNNAGFITSSALSGYATETWVGNQGYITGITSSDVTTALGYTPYSDANPNGYTSNVGTVTSVNNVSPVSGNVTLSIPTDTGDLTNGAGFITSSALADYVTTNTAQDISAKKTFLGEKAILFKQTATTDKLGFTLYNSGGSELGALEYRPNTISGGALINLNTSQSGTAWVGFRYWSNINIIAPKPANGTYYIPVNITNGTNTVTASNNGTVNISSLISGKQDVSNLVTSVSASSTDSQYPSAKLFYDTCGDIETLINAL